MIELKQPYLQAGEELLVHGAIAGHPLRDPPLEDADVVGLRHLEQELFSGGEAGADDADLGLPDEAAGQRDRQVHERLEADGHELADRADDGVLELALNLGKSSNGIKSGCFCLRNVFKCIRSLKPWWNKNEPIVSQFMRQSEKL